MGPMLKEQPSILKNPYQSGKSQSPTRGRLSKSTFTKMQKYNFQGFKYNTSLHIILNSKLFHQNTIFQHRWGIHATFHPISQNSISLFTAFFSVVTGLQHIVHCEQKIKSPPRANKLVIKNVKLFSLALACYTCQMS